MRVGGPAWGWGGSGSRGTAPARRRCCQTSTGSNSLPPTGPHRPCQGSSGRPRARRSRFRRSRTSVPRGCATLRAVHMQQRWECGVRRAACSARRAVRRQPPPRWLGLGNGAVADGPVACPRRPAAAAVLPALCHLLFAAGRRHREASGCRRYRRGRRWPPRPCTSGAAPTAAVSSSARLASARRQSWAARLDGGCWG